MEERPGVYEFLRMKDPLMRPVCVLRTLDGREVFMYKVEGRYYFTRERVEPSEIQRYFLRFKAAHPGVSPYVVLE